MRRSALPLAAAILALTLSACGQETVDEPAAASDSPAASDDSATTDAEEGPAEEAHHFNYDPASDHGPANWGRTPGWERCSTGKRQSPIDVPAAQAAPLAARVDLDYAAGTVSALNNSHTVNVRPDGANTATLKRKGRSDAFKLAQFHIHADSEHDLDGTASPLEAHFVHGKVDGSGEFITATDPDTGEPILEEYLVIGVMLNEGAANDAWGAILDPAVLPAEPGEDYAVVLDKQFDPSTLLPAEQSAYSYIGSLTTPTPTCVEGVNWFVLTTPVEISSEQIKAFTDLYDNNSRPLQSRS